MKSSTSPLACTYQNCHILARVICGSVIRAHTEVNHLKDKIDIDCRMVNEPGSEKGLLLIYVILTIFIIC